MDKNKLSAFIISVVIMITSFNFVPMDKIVAYDYLSYGIDVSKFQGSIDWDAVAADRVDFAIVRAGTTSINGETYSQDSYFEYNYTNAKKAGIKLGAYYYCGAYSEAGFRQNAYDFLNSLSGKSFEFPVYIDIEQASKQKDLGKTTLTTYILSALNIISDAGYTAGVYANKDWFTNYIDISRIKNAGYEIWWAQYPSGSYAVDPTGYDKSSECSVWQYSSLGSVRGINGNVDLDVSYINYSNTVPKPPTPHEPDTGSYSTGTYVVNTSSGLRVRSTPDTSGAVLCAAPNSTSFYVEKVSGDWGYTSSITGYVGDNLMTKAGWVNLAYCLCIAPDHDSSYKLGAYRVNTASGVNIRSEANGEKVLSASPNGTEFVVTQVSGEWGYTDSIGGWTNDIWTNHAGWVSLKYCEYIGSISSEATTTVTTTATKTTTLTKATTVTAVPVTTISVSDDPPVIIPKELTINVDDTYDLIVLNCNDPDSIIWISSNKNVATVDNGTVTAVSAGEATIYAVINNIYCEIRVTVQGKGNVLFGDVNNDNMISVADAVLLEKYLLGADKFTKEMYDSADMNNDGSVDVFDMILMRKALINL